MAKVVSGQHMRFQPMKSHAMSHNHRLSVPSYVHSEKSDLNVTYVQTDKRSLTQYVKEVKADYQEHVGRRYQDNFSPIWETLIVVNDNTKDEDIERAIKLIEEKTNLKIVDAVRHKDEGHYDKDGEYIANDHVHLIAKRYDFETHRHVVLDVQQIRELRKDVADTLGIAYTQTKEGEKPKKNISHHKFREEAQKEQIVELQKELSKDRAKDYNLKEMQSRIVNLEGANAELRKELHAQNRDINKTKDLEEKERKITELEAKIDELQKENTELHYNFRDIQKQITALEVTPGEKKELHRLNTEINKMKIEGATKDLKISELIEQIITKDQAIDQLTEAQKDSQNIPKISQPAHEPINASKIANLQSENEMLQITNRVLEREVSELKENRAAPSIDVEPIRAVLRSATISDQSPSNEEIIKRQKEIEDLRKYDGKRIIGASKETTALGNITGAKKLDEALLERNIDKILAQHFGLHKDGDRLIDKLHKAKDAIIDSTKSLIKRAEMTLEAFFSKKTRDLSSTPKKELTELPRDITAPKTNEDKMREFVDKQKSPGGDLGQGR